MNSDCYSRYNIILTKLSDLLDEIRKMESALPMTFLEYHYKVKFKTPSDKKHSK